MTCALHLDVCVMIWSIIGVDKCSHILVDTDTEQSNDGGVLATSVLVGSGHA